jgi:hypothetical protein
MRLSSICVQIAVAMLSSPVRGQSVLAHRVVLEGTIGDQLEVLERLVERHGACVTSRLAVNQPVSQTAMPTLPADLTTTQQQVYYAADRIVEEQVVRGFRVTETCAIEHFENRSRRIHTSRGVCDIDFRHHEARGPCRPQDRGTGPSSQVPQSRLADFRRPTGLRRVIAGVPCEVFRTEGPYVVTICVAKPLSRFPLGSSSLNGGARGLLLAHEMRPTSVTVQATLVALHEQVPAEIFQVPSGMRYLWVNP